MDFYCGIPEPAWASRFELSMISINRLRRRVGDFDVNSWMMDSGAFSEISRFKNYRSSPAVFATEARRWSSLGRCVAVVTQDYMCEKFILDLCSRSVSDHQRMTVSRYDALSFYGVGAYLMPVLQGYSPAEYVDCVRLYGRRLAFGSWVGVGSVCKRNSEVKKVVDVLLAIKSVRPDLRLHGFGLKKTAVASPDVRALLYSSDSMAWSMAARREGRNCNHWSEALEYSRSVRQLAALPV